jgi:hypothetical protein
MNETMRRWDDTATLGTPPHIHLFEMDNARIAYLDGSTNITTPNSDDSTLVTRQRK